MASFVAVLDADPVRRAMAVEALRHHIAPVPGLRLGALELGPCSVVWAAGPHTPVSVHQTDEGMAVLWGDAYDGRTRQDAAGAARAWRPALAGAAPTVLDGFHAGVVFEAGLGLVAASDLMGLFPLFHGSRDGVTIIASCASLFAQHPAFGHEVDREGLAGILLTGAPVAGRTARAGVQRLTAGHLVVAPPHARATERFYYAVHSTSQTSTVPLARQAAALREALREAHCQQIQESEPIGILLSGGRDSRIHAALLHERRIRATALTFGLPTDYEAQCAAAVARRCRFPHRLQPLDPTRMPAAAAMHSHWGDLTAGFTTVHMWSALDAIATLPSRFVTGYHFDAFFGRPAVRRPQPFDALFRVLNAVEVPEAHAASLFGNDGPALVDAAKGLIHGELQALDRDPVEWGWRTSFAIRERQQPGAVPWRLSFASWPVLPHLNRGVLDVIGALSSSSLAGRVLQDEVLMASYPRLAELPLDRNSANTSPLLPPTFPRLARWTQGSAARAATQPGPAGLERRFFVRTYDFNGAGWRGVRGMADAVRERASAVFDQQALERVLPRAGVDIPFDDATIHSRGHKTLVGAVLWAAQDGISP